MNIPKTNLKRVVIVGGGFGGLEIAKRLKGAPYQVVLIDQHNYHMFQPLLYQVATAGLEPDSIAHPLRKIFRGREQFFFRMAHVEAVDHERKSIHSNIGDLSYDYLVLATGSSTNFFGNQEIEQWAMSMKNITESLDIRSLILQHFEEALLTDDLSKREALMNVVIVGGGPTGVELAGAISELRKHVLPRDYPDLDVRRMHVHIVEAAPRVLASMSEEASAAAQVFLEKMGVQIWLNTAVSSYDGETVVAGEHTLKSRTLIWAAGVKGAPVGGLPEGTLLKNGRIAVNHFNQVEGIDGVFVIGDVAQMMDETHPKGHPMLAQVAMQQGKLLADNLKAWATNKEPKPFVYKDLGSMATVGRNKAVVDLPKYKFQGFFAWFVWMGVHVIQLIGFRNKLLVLINWSYNYFNYSRDIRLIIRPFLRKSKTDNL
ncbi:MAG: NAD(P)/FAD-dependent oxidoreductase [Flavobacteriales bacterium]|jgi:NADH dehydrogenase|nr:NAD(P)/FAD-dependent oxidoreductase [Flavobacteriales bacterium]